MKTSRQNFLILLISIVFIGRNLHAQTNTFPSTGAAGIGTMTPNASSSLDISSTTKGILIPRMTQAQRNAIVAPATGLMIYQTNNTPGFYYYNGTAWTAVSAKGANAALSNLKAPTAVNQNLLPAITDSVDMGSSSLMWRNAYLSGDLNVNGDGYIHGITIGVGSGNMSLNLAVGFQALHSNTTGNYNTAHGSWSLFNNTTGTLNTAIGNVTLFSNTTGTANTASGNNTLQNNTVGSGNTANGSSALFSNSAGNGNVAIGAGSLYSNTTQSNLVAVGDSALRNNTTGAVNTALGSKSLYSNTDGAFNTATGSNSLYSNTTGYYNTGNGAHALYSNTTGSFNTANGLQALYYNTTGTTNTATGYRGLFSNTTGYDNTAHGSAALSSNTIGYNNTANGSAALVVNTSGSNNVAEGVHTLYGNTTGSNNTAMGAWADVSLNNLTNATAIGYNAIVDASNKVRIGNSFVTVVESQAGSWTISDGRFKNNIKEDVKGLEFIKLLRPVTYNFDTKKFEEFLMQNYADSVKAKKIESMKQAFERSTSIRQTGFVAQDVFEAAGKSGYNFNGVHAPENPTDNWSLSYEKLVVPLVKAVQELSSQNDDMKSEVANLKSEKNAQQKQIDELKQVVLSLQQSFNSCNPCVQQTFNNLQSQSKSVINLVGASLAQNIPNPFNHTTTINYTLPQTYSSAKIIVTDRAGKVLKQENLVAKGKGSLNVDASAFSSGAYQYSLYVDGKLVDTKQMVLTK